MKNLLILAIAAAAAASAQVGFDRLVQAEKEPQNWLTYSGNYNSQRYSKLTQITPESGVAVGLPGALPGKIRSYSFGG